MLTSLGLNSVAPIHTPQQPITNSTNTTNITNAPNTMPQATSNRVASYH